MPDSLNREAHEFSSHEEWAEIRRKHNDLTCSEDIPTLLGVNPYGNVQNVIDRKRGIAVESPTVAQVKSRRRGLLMEHVFPTAIAEEHPDWEITKANAYHRIPELRLGCSLDYWRNPGRVIVETKSTNERRWEENHCQPLPSWKVQVHGQMLITDAPSAVIAVIVANADLPLHLFEIERDRFIETEIIAAVTDFWAGFDADQPPMAPPPAIAAMLDDGSHIDLSADNFLPQQLALREDLAATRGDAEKRIKEIDSEIKARMGAASSGWLDGWQISYKTEHRKGYTVAPSDPRVLRVRRTKELDDE